MLRSMILNAVGLIALSVAGCTTNSAALRPRASTLPSVTVAGSPPNSPSSSTEPAPAATENILHTTLSPVEAAERVLEVFQGFRFGVNYNYQAGNQLGTTGDYFAQHVDSVSADQKSVSVECDWVSEDLTDVHFRSNLPPDHYKFVLKRISEEMNRKPVEPN